MPTDYTLSGKSISATYTRLAQSNTATNELIDGLGDPLVNIATSGLSANTLFVTGDTTAGNILASSTAVSIGTSAVPFKDIFVSSASLKFVDTTKAGNDRVSEFSKKDIDDLKQGKSIAKRDDGSANDTLTATTISADSIIARKFIDLDNPGQLSPDIKNLSGQMQSLESATADQKGQIGGLESATASLDTKTSSLESATGHLASMTGALAAGTGAVQSAVDSLESATGTLDTKTTALAAGTGANASKVTSLESATGVLNTKATALATGTGNLQSAVDSIEAATGTLNTKTTALAAGTGSLQSAVDSIESATASMITGTTLFHSLSATTISGMNNLHYGDTISFVRGGVTQAYLLNDGTLNISGSLCADGDFIPAKDAVKQLGKSDKRFTDLYLASNIHSSNSGLSFMNSSSCAVAELKEDGRLLISGTVSAAALSSDTMHFPNSLSFVQAGATKAYMLNDGSLFTSGSLSSEGDFIPAKTAVSKLGKADKRFSDLYLASNIHSGTAGLTFKNESGSSVMTMGSTGDLTVSGDILGATTGSNIGTSATPIKEVYVSSASLNFVDIKESKVTKFSKKDIDDLKEGKSIAKNDDGSANDTLTATTISADSIIARKFVDLDNPGQQSPEIKNLSAQVQSIEGATGVQKGQISSLESATGALNTKTTALAAGTGSLQSAVDSIESATGTLNTKTTALAAGTGSLQSAVDSIEAATASMIAGTTLFNSLSATTISGMNNLHYGDTISFVRGGVTQAYLLNDGTLNISGSLCADGDFIPAKDAVKKLGKADKRFTDLYLASNIHYANSLSLVQNDETKAYFLNDGSLFASGSISAERDFIPAKTAVSKLGKADKRFSDIYLNSTIHSGTAGLTFANESGSAVATIGSTGDLTISGNIMGTTTGSDIGSSGTPIREIYVSSASLNFVDVSKALTATDRLAKFTKKDIEDLKKGKSIAKNDDGSVNDTLTATTISADSIIARKFIDLDNPGELSPDIKSLSAAIASVETATGSQKGQIGGLEAATGNLNNNITSLIAATGHLASMTGTVQAAVDSLESATGTLNTKATALAAGTGAVQSAVDSLESTTGKMIAGQTTFTNLAATNLTASTNIKVNNMHFPSSISFVHNHETKAYLLNDGSLFLSGSISAEKDFIPAKTAVLKLGKQDKRFSDLYLNSTIHSGTAGLTFANESGSAVATISSTGGLAVSGDIVGTTTATNIGSEALPVNELYVSSGSINFVDLSKSGSELDDHRTRRVVKFTRADFENLRDGVPLAENANGRPTLTADTISANIVIAREFVDLDNPGQKPPAIRSLESATSRLEALKAGATANAAIDSLESATGVMQGFVDSLESSTAALNAARLALSADTISSAVNSLESATGVVQGFVDSLESATGVLKTATDAKLPKAGGTMSGVILPPPVTAVDQSTGKYVLDMRQKDFAILDGRPVIRAITPNGDGQIITIIAIRPLTLSVDTKGTVTTGIYSSTNANVTCAANSATRLIYSALFKHWYVIS